MDANTQSANSQWTSIVTCPVCAFDMTGIVLVDCHQGTKRHTITRCHHVHQTNADKSGRGSVVTLTFSCESGHYWDVRYSFHKGSTECTTTVRSDIQADLLPTLWRD